MLVLSPDCVVSILFDASELFIVLSLSDSNLISPSSFAMINITLMQAQVSWIMIAILLLNLSSWVQGIAVIDPTCASRSVQIRKAEANIIRWAQMSDTGLNRFVNKKEGISEKWITSEIYRKAVATIPNFDSLSAAEQKSRVAAAKSQVAPSVNAEVKAIRLGYANEAKGAGIAFAEFYSTNPTAQPNRLADLLRSRF